MSLLPPRPHEFNGGLTGHRCVICGLPWADHPESGGMLSEEEMADLDAILRTLKPPKRDGGQWVASNVISDFVRESAQKQALGLDWFVNGDGLGWAWIPDGWTSDQPPTEARGENA